MFYTINTQKIYPIKQVYKIKFKIIFKTMKQKKISIAITPELLNKLDEGKFNKSKLIDSLITKHFEKKTK